MTRYFEIALTLMFVTATIAVAGLAPWHGRAQAESPPGVEELLSRLGYTAEDRADLLAGKIVATDLERTRDDQLIAAVAMFLPVETDRLAENARRGLNIGRDAEVLAHGPLEPGDGPGAVAAIAFDSSEQDEVARLIEEKSGKDFNLSRAEIKALRKALAGMNLKNPAAGEAWSKAYRGILDARYRAYLAGGLDGIAPYRQGGDTIDAAKRLRAATAQTEPFLSTYFPAFQQALADFPAGLSPDISSRIYWIKRRVEGRPAFILAHQLVESGEGYVLFAQRQFFVGHTYDALQAVALARAVEGGSVVFYVNTAFTDRITGFMSGIASSVGQGRMRDDLTKFFDEARKQISP